MLDGLDNLFRTQHLKEKNTSIFKETKMVWNHKVSAYIEEAVTVWISSLFKKKFCMHAEHHFLVFEKSENACETYKDPLSCWLLTIISLNYRTDK